MYDTPADAEYLQIILYHSYDTPQDFVVGLLQSVFNLSAADARAVVQTIEKYGKGVCGSYPRTAAKALLKSAQGRIDASSHLLLITAEAGDDAGVKACRMCGDFAGENQIRIAGKTIPVCDACALAVAAQVNDTVQRRAFKYAGEALEWHFAGLPGDQLVATARQFPGHMRADVQAAVDELFSAAPVRFFGVHESERFETLTIAALTLNTGRANVIAPAQYIDIDIGEAEPVKCLNNGLWLCLADELRYAVLSSTHREYGGETAARVEIAVPAGVRGAEFVKDCFDKLERAVGAARAYRGKVLSFDNDANYRGSSRGLMVHKLPPVRREDVILPEATLKLLDRNVIGFVEGREQLRRFGQSTRKGILLYGPPGTGKTHTIRYLATNLPGHTTLIITAAQVAWLSHYMSLARLLQPAMVVIEDVDLIARARENIGPCEESLLNRLLNEMDGLKEDADILFVLTTNRPEQLESALSSRPGRVDQAIEVPLPDDINRGKLVRLYGKGLPIDTEVISEAVQRTEGVSAAFIKELMRRVAQVSIGRDGGATVHTGDLSEALDEMLFASGKLNIKLLGGALEMAAG
jgi:ATP-dependent Clp protease adapter protein ClpS